MNSIEPRISNGRAFISPILGCCSRCIYCYLAIKDYNIPHANLYGIDKTIEFLKKDKSFKSGKKGTIISVGAWGDLFPSNTGLRKYSVEWIVRLLALGNPMQIMSKNILTDKEIDEITASIIYTNQLLYSTTITTFEYAGKIESGAADPMSRLMVLNEFSKRSVPISVMIKPYIPGIVNDESIIENLKLFKSVFCVVGKLYVNEDILRQLTENEFGKKIIEKIAFHSMGVISCVEETAFNTYSNDVIDNFISKLLDNNMKVFKKSSCINSNILNMENSNRKRYLAEGCCMKCGNCKH